MASAPYFSPKTFEFLSQLQRHNNADWFHAHKESYENLIRQPALRLIEDLQPKLTKVSPHMTARASKQGGSLFRVLRDTRRKHPGGPYKPWIGLRFYHEDRN